jgi:hypothetical protein
VGDRPVARLLASALLAMAVLAGSIMRLRRIERPVFDPITVAADGQVQLGRVRLARRGERGREIGWSVRCQGREVWSRLGADVSVRLVSDAGPVHLQDLRDGRAIPLPACVLHPR